MKVVQINSVCGIGSTGRIAVGISQSMLHEEIENCILYTASDSTYTYAVKYGSRYYIKFQALLSRITGRYGFVSAHQTKKLIRELDRQKPDIVHIHNIHGHDCNIEKLFAYLKRNKIKAVFTLHDCWFFTGYCPYFTAANCSKWITGCKQCPQYRKASFFFDKSHQLQEKKKSAFEGLDATIVTPSVWLADLARQSFLQQFPIKVIHNGIDLNIFKPTASDLRHNLNCQNKFVLLGVSTEWGPRKGLDVFVRLAEDLNDAFQIILVGTNAQIDAILPENILSIHRTDSPKQLAELYSLADLFVNPTREDNFPTVNIESLACGTPVLTYRTGGSPEIIDAHSGIAVECDHYEMLKSEILRIKETQPFVRENCVSRAQKFHMNDKFKEYVDLYESIIQS